MKVHYFDVLFDFLIYLTIYVTNPYWDLYVRMIDLFTNKTKI